MEKVDFERAGKNAVSGVPVWLRIAIGIFILAFSFLVS